MKYIWQKTLVGFAFLFVLAAVGCKELKGLERYRNTILSAGGVQLYEIEDFPTEKSAQVVGKQYFEDFAVKKQIDLSETQRDSLKKLVADWTNYDTAQVKSCPFLPNFAIQFATKTETVRLVVGVSPCGRVQLSGSNKNYESKTVELVPDSNIEKWLAQFAISNENL